MSEERDKKIEAVMHSLDKLERVEANHFLYGKIRHRMMLAQQALPARLGFKMVASLSVVIIMNLITVAHFYSNNSGAKDGSRLVAKEYAISLPELY